MGAKRHYLEVFRKLALGKAHLCRGKEGGGRGLAAGDGNRALFIKKIKKCTNHGRQVPGLGEVRTRRRITAPHSRQANVLASSNGDTFEGGMVFLLRTTVQIRDSSATETGRKQIFLKAPRRDQGAGGIENGAPLRGSSRPRVKKPERKLSDVRRRG